MRTVLCVDPLGMVDPATGAQMMVLKVDPSPFVNPQGLVFHPFKLSPKELPPWTSPQAVMQRGRMIREALHTHPGVQNVLTQLWNLPHGELRPIFIKLTRSEAELLCWETLCNSNDKFVALDRRWPIGRISMPTTNYGRPPATFQEPVRMMAIISAFGIHQQVKEWELIFAQALAIRNELKIHLLVLAADPKTRVAVQAAINNGNDWIELGHIEKTPKRILQEVVRWNPHILHFFCHGMSNDEEQVIELATAADYLDDTAAGGSVTIPAEQIVDLAGQLTNPWLLMLNCCVSGKAARDLHSIAHQVVAAGFPAAVAMIEPVDAMDAHEFARTFYGSVFAKFVDVAVELKTNQTVSFEWAEALCDARGAISDLHQSDPKSSPEWAFPVLYVNGIAPMNFQRPAAPAGPAPVAGAQPHAAATAQQVADYTLRSKIVAEWLSVVRDKMSFEDREAALKKVLAGVPEDYWPTPDGIFNHE